MRQLADKTIATYVVYLPVLFHSLAYLSLLVLYRYLFVR